MMWTMFKLQLLNQPTDFDAFMQSIARLNLRPLACDIVDSMCGRVSHSPYLSL